MNLRSIRDLLTNFEKTRWFWEIDAKEKIKNLKNYIDETLKTKNAARNPPLNTFTKLDWHFFTEYERRKAQNEKMVIEFFQERKIAEEKLSLSEISSFFRRLFEVTPVLGSLFKLYKTFKLEFDPILMKEFKISLAMLLAFYKTNQLTEESIALLIKFPPANLDIAKTITFFLITNEEFSLMNKRELLFQYSRSLHDLTKIYDILSKGGLINRGNWIRLLNILPAQEKLNQLYKAMEELTKYYDIRIISVICSEHGTLWEENNTIIVEETGMKDYFKVIHQKNFDFLCHYPNRDLATMIGVLTKAKWPPDRILTKLNILALQMDYLPEVASKLLKQFEDTLAKKTPFQIEEENIDQLLQAAKIKIKNTRIVAFSVGFFRANLDNYFRDSAIDILKWCVRPFL